MDDDDQDKPRLQLVSENPKARTDRQISWAKEQVERAISEFAAALLRTMAGSDAEAVHLMRRLSHFIDALSKFQQEAGRGLTVAELEAMLRLPPTEFESAEDDWRHRRWLREHGMEVIVKGALRLAAHKILGEEPHFGGKYSEGVIKQGIETLEELKRPPQPVRQPKVQKTKDLAQTWDDLSPPMEPPKRPRFGERLGRGAGFNEDDLKELRKAIKANDKKRIAELTAKIGKPKFES